MDTQAVIDDYLLSESKMKWWDKAISNYPQLQSTASLCNYRNRSRQMSSYTFRPSAPQQAIGIVIIIFVALALTGLFRMLLQFRYPFLVILFACLMMLFIIYMVLKNLFLDRNLNYSIVISQQGMIIRSRQFPWKDIAGTYLMWRMQGRTTNYFLLIVLHDATIKKFDLYNFAVNQRKLATLIESYKPKDETDNDQS